MAKLLGPMMAYLGRMTQHYRQRIGAMAIIVALEQLFGRDQNLLLLGLALKLPRTLDIGER